MSEGDLIEKHSVHIDHAGFLIAAERLKGLVDCSAEERHLQKHIEKHPYLLSQQFAHCHHVVPNFAFGDKYVADFMCLDWPSKWPHWVGVELEAPSKPLFTNKGRKTALLEHALQQVRDWRWFVEQNLDYANKPRSLGGLGLEHAAPNMVGYVYIGRRPTTPKGQTVFRKLRDEIARENIYVYTWDGVVEWALKRAAHFSDISQGIVIDSGDGSPIVLKPIKGGTQ